MTKLSAEAYAIVEGRHSDPFHYLGLHTEGDRTVVFLPEASNVEAIGEHGEAAELARIHDAGLFAGALPNVIPQTTDEELHKIALEYLFAAFEEGIHVAGSLFDELVTLRKKLRSRQPRAWCP